jgi:Ca2+-binding EF-hand superfamily protein
MLGDMPRLSSFAFLSALASLSLAGACKSDDAGGSTSPQQPSATAAAPAPAPDDASGDVGTGAPGGNMNERRAQRMQKFDTNRDGKLNRDERKVMMGQRIDRRMQRMDADRDGKISRQEIASRNRGRFAQHLSAEFDRADQNRDTFLSREELGKAMQRFRVQRRAERQQAGGAAPGRAAPRGGGAPPPDEDDDYGDSLDE